MQTQTSKEAILAADTYLGIELDSTRIKMTLVDAKHQPLATGSYAWQNRLEDGIWTYRLEEAMEGLRACYGALRDQVLERYGATLTRVAAMGVSGMMHGYLPLDAAGAQLAPFRTWRNTMTGEESAFLRTHFGYNIPQRWSIAHLYQCICQDQPHVPHIRHLTTLAGYIHWRLTGEWSMGIGEASGMFPVDVATGGFHGEMLDSFDHLIAHKGYPWRIRQILPQVKLAGEGAGFLTEAGAALLDETHALRAGIPLCPPEGDAQTGMVATNSVRPGTGNVSAGTSIFAMAVLEHPLAKVYPQINVVTTPAGKPVAMVHCTNCTGDLDAWVRLFGEAAALFGPAPDPNELYGRLYSQALQGDEDCGKLLSYNYYSGESLTKLDQGRPLFVRLPESRFNLANFMRVQLFAALSTLRLGMDILRKEEGVDLYAIAGHGGFFKVEEVGQRFMAAALDTPVTVSATAGEGGPWGMAALAGYMVAKEPGQSLGDYLEERVFAHLQTHTLAPRPEDAASFQAYFARFQAGLPVERAAVETLL